MPQLCFALFVKRLLGLLTGVLYVCLICSSLFLKFCLGKPAQPPGMTGSPPAHPANSMCIYGVITPLWFMVQHREEPQMPELCFALFVKRGVDPKGAVDQRDTEDNEPSLPARSQGCTGAAEEEVVAQRLAAMKAKSKVEGDRTLYTTKPRAEPMDVTCAPVTACQACKNTGGGVKHHWFHECPGLD